MADTLVPIKAGEWVLAYVEPYGPYPGEDDVVVSLDRLNHRAGGWDCIRNAHQLFDVLKVSHVMPKTFRCLHGKRRWRNNVVAASSSATAGEMLVLRDKLFSIGTAADRLIADEMAKRIAEFERKTRADALAQVHAALPHIFGRSA